MSVFLADGQGNFNAANEIPIGEARSAFEVGDFNGDGRPDLAVASAKGPVTILLGDGAGNLAVAGSFDAGGGANAIVSGDFDGDGKLDLAVARTGLNVVSFLRGDGTGNFASAGGYLAGVRPVAISVPSTVPRTVICRATMSPVTVASAPMVTT